MRTYVYDPAMTYSAGYRTQDYIYFSCNIFNALFRYELKTGKTEHLGIFEDEPLLAMGLHQKAFGWNEKIVFAPASANALCIFDPADNSVEYVKLPGTEGETGIDAVLFDDKVWIFYVSKKCPIYVVDLKTRSYEKLESITKKLANVIRPGKKTAFYTRCAVEGGYIYSAVWGTDTVLKADLKSGSFELIQIPVKGIQLSGVAYSDENLYLTALSDWNVYRFNLQSKRTDAYTYQGCKSERQVLYPLIIAFNKHIIAFPTERDDILTIDDAAMKLKPFCGIPEGYDSIVSDGRCYWKRFYSYSIEDDKLTILPYSSKMRLTISGSDHTCGRTEMVFEESFIDDLFERIYKPGYIETEKKKPVVRENPLYSFEDFIKNI